MPRHIDVRVRIPVRSLGIFVDEILPDWAEVLGFDKLAAMEGERPNGHARPGPKKPGGPPAKGTAAAKLHEYIKRSPGKMRADIFKVMLARGLKEQALSSALYHMRDRGLIEQNSEGGWLLSKGGDE